MATEGTRVVFSLKGFGKRGIPRWAFFATLVFLVAALFSAPLFASPTKIAQKKAEAARIKAQIDEIDRQLEEAVEEYNSATIRLQEIQKAIQETRSDLERATNELVEAQRVLDERLVGIYKHGNVSFLSVLLTTEDFNGFLLRLEYLIRVADQDMQVLEKVKRIKAEIEEKEAKLKEEEALQAAVQHELRAKKEQIEGQIRERKAFLASLEEEIAGLIKEEEERQARLRAEALRRAQEEQARRALLSRGGTASRAPSSPIGAQVVSIAKQYLGVPYHWAAPTQNGGCPTGEHALCFDCSGLTMWCFSQVGIPLLHSSAWQYNHSIPVDYENMEPGDLVFFGRNHIYHVGIYVGDGNFLHARRTGDVVNIEPLSAREDYVGAGRLYP
jgi:cell wall-associated NlpC family hydrolase